ncbi:MAG: cobalamin-dependent protein [Eubacterium sp.]
MSKLVNALRDLEEDLVYQTVDEEIAAGLSPLTILEECNAGLVAVGELFGEGTYYLTELMFSVEIMEEVLNKIRPLMNNGDSENAPSKGKILIGTVKGDIHDVGKNIVVSLLRSYGYDAVDLGIDVSAEQFIAAIRENPDAKILGLSALLNTTYPEMKIVIDTLKKEGLKDNIKVIIGGTICSEQVRAYTGADAFAVQAMTGIEFCNQVYA